MTQGARCRARSIVKGALGGCRNALTGKIDDADSKDRRPGSRPSAPVQMDQQADVIDDQILAGGRGSCPADCRQMEEAEAATAAPATARTGNSRVAWSLIAAIARAGPHRRQRQSGFDKIKRSGSGRARRPDRSGVQTAATVRSPLQLKAGREETDARIAASRDDTNARRLAAQRKKTPNSERMTWHVPAEAGRRVAGSQRQR